VGDAELRVELRRDEGRLEAGQHDAVDGARVNVALRHDPATGVAQGEAGRMVPLRGAADQEPAALCAPRGGRKTLRPLEGGVRADVDALDPGRDVVLEGRLPEGRNQRRVGSLAALVAGDVEPPGLALGVGDDGVEVRRLPLVHRRLLLAALRRLDRLAGHASRH